MVKGAVITLLVSAAVLLALAPQVEAQCKSIDISSLQVCLASIDNKRCEDNCKDALQPYFSQPEGCICQLVAQGANLGLSFGISEGDITELIVECGQAAPNCR